MDEGGEGGYAGGGEVSPHFAAGTPLSPEVDVAPIIFPESESAWIFCKDCLHVATSTGEVGFRKKTRRCEELFGDMGLAALETKVNDRQTLKDDLIERIREEDKDRRPGSQKYITKKQLI